VKVLIKLGGTLLDDEGSRRSLAVQIARAATQHSVVVVHGGGKQMTRHLAERGVDSRFEGGLRVTSPEVLDAVLKVFAGSVNKQLVASLTAEGASAVGLTGADSSLAVAEQMKPELGFVGRILRSEPRLLNVLVDNGFLPVVACVAGDAAGHIYNVNADQMASAIAAGFRADQVLFLTDVEGVKDGSGQLISALTCGQAQDLIDSGVASGGMQAKLTYATEALQGGAGEVRIAAGAAHEIVARMLDGAPLGTRLLR
jgi:acetylglutamate kinase